MSLPHAVEDQHQPQPVLSPANASAQPSPPAAAAAAAQPSAQRTGSTAAPAAAAAQKPAVADDDEEGDFDLATLQARIKQSSSNNGKAEKYAAETAGKTEAEVIAEAKKIFAANVVLFSGASDHQTAADAKDTGAFGLPQVAANDKCKAGGACTNAIQSILKKRAMLAESAVGGAAADLTFAELLLEMRDVLKDMGYTQNPCLSSSRQMDLTKEKFAIVNAEEQKYKQLFEMRESGAGGGTGLGASMLPKRAPRRRALIIGINYRECGDADAVLNGCVNDAKMAFAWVKQEGYKVDDPDCVRYLTDDPAWTMATPTGKVVLEHLEWLARDALPGDSLFWHFSGHGIQLPDLTGQEEDGFDEAIACLDFDNGGTIRDEVLFKAFVGLPAGVSMVCVVDACHSGSIMDLAFTFEATQQNAEALVKGQFTRLLANSVFSYHKAKNWTIDVASGAWDGAKDLHQTTVKYFQKQKCCSWCCSWC